MITGNPANCKPFYQDSRDIRVNKNAIMHFKQKEM
jgi:hypothetical protein